MKKTALFCLLLTASGLAAQPYPRQDRFIDDNKKRITDTNVSLFSLHSDYDFPYLIPTREDITEKLVRILNYLERETPKAIVDAKTGKKVGEDDPIPYSFLLEKGDYRPHSYEWGVTYIGMLRAAQATGLKEFENFVFPRMELFARVLPEVKKRLETDKKYDSPLDRAALPQNMDQCGALCAAMLYTSQIKGEQINLEPMINLAIDLICQKHPRLADGTLARKDPYENTIWLDDMYMSVPALSQMYVVTGDKKYLDDAIAQVIGFSERMFVPETGLYMHSWVDAMDVHPHLYWGRANGWATLAMCELLDVIPAKHPKYQTVLEQFRAHCFGLLNYQSRKGMWHQLLDRNDSYLESSATAMFVYGLAHGINWGWLDPKAFGPAALAGWNALSEQINNEGQIENICVGTGVSYEPAYYYNRKVHVNTAHGYGPVLMAGSEILLLTNHFPVKQKTSIYFYDRK